MPVWADEHVGVLVEGEAFASVYGMSQKRMRGRDQLKPIITGKLEKGLAGICGVTEQLVDCKIRIGQHCLNGLLAGDGIANLPRSDAARKDKPGIGILHYLRLIAEELGVGTLVACTGVRVARTVCVMVKDVIH